jgi:hypothetical protein
LDITAYEDVNVKTEIQIDSVRTISFETFTQMNCKTIDENHNLKSKCEQPDWKQTIKQEQLTGSFGEENENVMVRIVFLIE